MQEKIRGPKENLCKQLWNGSHMHIWRQYLFITLGDMPGKSNIELTINWRIAKKHQNQKQEEKMHKEVQKTCQTNKKKQTKIAGKRYKQKWLKKVWVDGQFEGLEEIELNNGFGQVIPDCGSVWESIPNPVVHYSAEKEPLRHLLLSLSTG